MFCNALIFRMKNAILLGNHFAGRLMSDFKKCLGLVALALFVWLLFLLSHLLVPFFIAAFLAYMGDPVVERLQRVGIARIVGVLIVFIIFIVIIVFLAFLVIPKIQEQLNMLIRVMPSFIDWGQKVMFQLVDGRANIKAFINPDHLKQAVSSQLGHISTLMNWLLRTITHSGIAVIDFLIRLLLIPVVTFYLMRDWPKLKSSLCLLIPRSKEDTVVSLAREADTVLAAFLKGQLFVMIVLAIIYSIGLSLVGLNFALILGVIIGLISIVPYLGSIVGVILAVTIAVFQFNGLGPVVWVLIVFVIGHILEGMVLTPWLIGGRIGLHPVAVIFSVSAGGVLFGFFGVLLALPVATVVMVFVRYYRDRYLTSCLYGEK